MKVSPLQLAGLEFIRVHIEPDLQARVSRADQFDFDGHTLAWSIDHGQGEDHGTWWVAVGVATNTTDEEPLCPYLIDIQAVGIFSVSSRVEATRREALVYENGAAIVYSAIREMITNITARSVAGPLVMPTPSFMGAFREQSQNAVEE